MKEKEIRPAPGVLEGQKVPPTAVKIKTDDSPMGKRIQKLVKALKKAG